MAFDAATLLNPGHFLALNGREDLGKAGGRGASAEPDLDDDNGFQEALALLGVLDCPIAVLGGGQREVLLLDVLVRELPEVSALVPGDMAAEKAPVTLGNEFDTHVGGLRECEGEG